MKTPEEIKKGLEICRGKCTGNKPHCPYDKYVNGCEDTLNRDALAYIQQLEARMEAFADEALIYIQKLEAQQPRWISVGEQLPEKNGEYLCFFEDGQIASAEFCKEEGGFGWREEYFDIDTMSVKESELRNFTFTVTQWMPLPPEEEEK